jgi:hypothetical protein
MAVERLAFHAEMVAMRDASEITGFDFGPRQGTFGTSNDKIDYLLLSPELFATATAGGILRSGVWRGPRVKTATLVCGATWTSSSCWTCSIDGPCTSHAPTR